VHATFRAEATTPAEIRRLVVEVARTLRLPPDVRDDLALGVTEAASNAVRHSGSGTVALECALLDDRVEVMIRDEGVFRWGAVPEEEEEAGPSLGLGIMAAVADRVEIREGSPQVPGTEVRLVKRFRSTD
jgi:anti-sigma regulatory factor (Ser/Thr protein kinase)